MVFVIIASIVIALLALAVIWLYNKIVRLKIAVRGSWGQVDVELRRRHDLVPNLVKVVKESATFETGTLERVVQARAGAVEVRSAGAGARSGPEGALSSALQGLLAVAEDYPVLATTGGYRDLQRELTNTEDRIAASRVFYNQTVEEYNATILTFPTMLVAAPFGFRVAEFFQLENASIAGVPDAEFDTGSTAQGA